MCIVCTASRGVCAFTSALRFLNHFCAPRVVSRMVSVAFEAIEWPECLMGAANPRGDPQS